MQILRTHPTRSSQSPLLLDLGLFGGTGSLRDAFTARGFLPDHQ
ncbi:hypothetical protein [Pectobacterium odoriferum]|nr:hypothetical protein [Pectobacterium odoriferum]